MMKEKEIEVRKVYVVLTRTGTILSHLIKIVTGEPYPHCSVSLDRELYKMYSFGRRNAWDPFNAGYVHERPDKNVFGRFKKADCRILELEVTEEQYKIMHHTMKDFWQHKEKYRFNYEGIVAAWFKKYPAGEHVFYCSQFTGYVLEQAGIPYTDKPYRRVRPEDFRTSPVFKVVYEGKLQDYWNMVKREND